MIGRNNIWTTLGQLLDSAHMQIETIERNHSNEARNQIPECSAEPLWPDQGKNVARIRFFRQNRLPPRKCDACSRAACAAGRALQNRVHKIAHRINPGELRFFDVTAELFFDPAE